MTKLESYNLAIKEGHMYQDRQNICTARQSFENLYCPFECKRCEKLIEKERQKLIRLQTEYKNKWGKEYH